MTQEAGREEGAAVVILESRSERRKWWQDGRAEVRRRARGSSVESLWEGSGAGGERPVGIYYRGGVRGEGDDVLCLLPPAVRCTSSRRPG